MRRFVTSAPALRVVRRLSTTATTAMRAAVVRGRAWRAASVSAAQLPLCCSRAALATSNATDATATTSDTAADEASIRAGSTSSTSSTSDAAASGATGTHTSARAAAPCASTTPDTAVLRYPYVVVDTAAQLAEAMQTLSRARHVALDVEALCRVDEAARQTPQLGTLSLVQMCSDAARVVHLFDVQQLTPSVFADAVRPLWSRDDVTTLMFDCRRDVEALNTQLGVVPRTVLDLQLSHTALQWRRRSMHRRSSLTYVLRSMAAVQRQDADSAVHAAMTHGRRAVWDVRPLPPHFLQYAADDVRHIYLLAPHLQRACADADVALDAVLQLTRCYVAHYAQPSRQPVTAEADAAANEVRVSWLRQYIGDGGVCAHCHAPGHTEDECFQKHKKDGGGGAASVVRCTYCHELGHTSRTCFRRQPQLLKCDVCGQVGHNASSCYKKNPCKYCGGQHSSANCLKRTHATSAARRSGSNNVTRPSTKR